MAIKSSWLTWMFNITAPTITSLYLIKIKNKKKLTHWRKIKTLEVLFVKLLNKHLFQPNLSTFTILKKTCIVYLQPFSFKMHSKKNPQLWRAFYLCKQTICICIFVISIAQLKLARNLLCICTSNSPPITTLEEDKKMENYGEGGGGGNFVQYTHSLPWQHIWPGSGMPKAHTHETRVYTKDKRKENRWKLWNHLFNQWADKTVMGGSEVVCYTGSSGWWFSQMHT